MRFVAVFGIALTTLVPQSARAQDQKVGGVANSPVGQAGTRQSPAQLAGQIEPMARIDSRIANRVQSRIRNRIDPNYDPNANATSPFEVAGERSRKPGLRTPR
jgi:hypothetical protein